MFIIILVLVAGMASMASGLRAQSTRTITAEEAIARALERSPERLRVEALERQGESMSAAAAPFFAERPELEVEYITESPFGERDYELTMGLLQEIPIWGTRNRRQGLAEAYRRAGENARDVLGRSIVIRTRLLYNRAWILAQEVGLINRLIASSSRLVEASDKRLAVGDMSTLERNTVVLEANRQKIEHEKLHAEHQQAVAELEALTGLQLAEAELQPDAVTITGRVIVDTMTYSLSPDWIQLENQIRIAEAELELARAEVNANPTIGLHYAQDLLTIDGDQIEYMNSSPRTIEHITAPGRAAGLSLSMQLPITIPGLWGPDLSDVAEREAELRMLEADRAALQIELAGKVARLRPRLTRIGNALAIYQASVELIEQNHELLDRGYLGGELSVTELLVGRQQLIQLQMEHLELIREMREAEIELQSLMVR